jgi:hypothetical protein
MTDRPLDTGVPPSGSGSRPSDRAADGVSPVPASIPNAAAIFARANEIAQERYPNGAGATVLASIVREAARELGLTAQRKACERVRNPNVGRHNRLDLLPEAQQIEARRICAERGQGNAAALCTDRGFVCYRCQDLSAASLAEQSERTGA